MENNKPGMAAADDGEVRDSLKRPDVEPAHDYWIVADVFVMEPGVGGMLLGELPHYRLREDAKIFEMTQADFDELIEEFHKDEGYYPDT